MMLLLVVDESERTSCIYHFISRGPSACVGKALQNRSRGVLDLAEDSLRDGNQDHIYEYATR